VNVAELSRHEPTLLGEGPGAVSIDSLVDAAIAERAESDANGWIKHVRHLRVDGMLLRDRFTFRGDSLWWFAELYLHKRRVLVSALRALYALEAVAAERRFPAWRVDGSDRIVSHVAREVAMRHGVPFVGPLGAKSGGDHFRQFAKGVFHTSMALADRLRPRHPLAGSGTGGVAAFVHSAFARENAGNEGYIGPVLAELQARLGPGALTLVGLGPRTNFRVREWRHRIREFTDPTARGLPLTPVEAFAGWRDLGPSLGQWRARGDVFRALAGSEDLREAAVVEGCDLWPLLASEFKGIAALQFPWSARAMDEAGAALDRLRPAVVVTYAEAGGWGRALILEARRRGIPVAALQHGFIYRHWLNYLHEPDEMAPSAANPSDRGFPAPDLTLLFDQFAREHLQRRGHFAPMGLAVTGSPRLDAIVGAARRMDGRARQAVRESVGAGDETPIVVVAAKYTQIAPVFRALVDLVRTLPDVLLIVKPHPAEGPAPYQREAAGVANVRMAAPGTDLAALTAVASALVTVNSTAAIEAMPLEVPALVVALPNNLSPFVEAGVMAGASGPDEIGPALRGLLYDPEMRGRLAAARHAFSARYGIMADGGAAARAADLIVGLSKR
jgi:hypothetical protein